MNIKAHVFNTSHNIFFSFCEVAHQNTLSICSCSGPLSVKFYNPCWPHQSNRWPAAVLASRLARIAMTGAQTSLFPSRPSSLTDSLSVSARWGRDVTPGARASAAKLLLMPLLLLNRPDSSHLWRVIPAMSATLPLHPSLPTSLSLSSLSAPRQ